MTKHEDACVAYVMANAEIKRLTDGIADSGFFTNPNQPKQVRHEH